MTEQENLNTNISAPPGCGLWAGWVVVNAIASGVGWRLGWFLSVLMPGTLAILTIGSVYGIVLGVGQWLVLRKEIGNSYAWFLASLVGYSVGFSGGVVLASYLNLTAFSFGVTTGIVFGVVAGIIQAFVLSRQVTRAFIWVPASIFAWATAFFYYSPNSFWVGGFYGIVSGLVTGTALMWLLYRPSD